MAGLVQVVNVRQVEFSVLLKVAATDELAVRPSFFAFAAETLVVGAELLHHASAAKRAHERRDRGSEADHPSARNRGAEAVDQGDEVRERIRRTIIDAHGEVVGAAEIDDDVGPIAEAEVVGVGERVRRARATEGGVPAARPSRDPRAPHVLLEAGPVRERGAA